MPACSVTADSQRSSPWPACGGQGRNAGAVSPWPQPASPGCSWRLHRAAGCWWGHGTATGNCWRGRKGGREEGQMAQSRSEEQPRPGRKAGKQKRNPACRQVQARVDARMHVRPPTQRVLAAARHSLIQQPKCRPVGAVLTELNPPSALTAMPAAKSRYSRPYASYILAPSPYTNTSSGRA